MRKPVKYAKLHGDAIFAPELGNLSATLPPLNKNVHMKLYWTDEDLEFEAEFQGRKVNGAFPKSAVQLVVFENEQPGIVKSK